MKILEDRVETSSMLRILTFSRMTPAVVATLAIYLSLIASNAALVIGKETIKTMVSDCDEHDERTLFP